MGKIVKQSFFTTVSSYIGVIVGYINVLWLMPYALSPEEIGIFRTIQDMGLLLVPFAQLGLGHGITRFYPRVKDHQFAFFSFSLFLTLIGFGVVALGFLAFKEQIIQAYAANSPEIINFLSVVLFITLFAVLNSVLDAFTRSFMKIAVPTFFREVVLRLLLALIVSAYLLGWLNFDQLMWGLADIYLFTLLGMIIYMVRNGMFKLSFNWTSLSTPFRKEYIQYSLITLLGTAGSILIMKIDSLMVTSMIGLDANAIYAIGFSIAVVIEMPRRAVSQVVMPVIAEKFALNQSKEINALYKSVAVNQLLLCLLIFLGIWANIDNLYHFVPNKEIYQAGKWVVLLIGLGKLCDVLFSVNGEIIVFSRFYIFNITSTLLMCVMVVVLNLLMIPIWGIEGAALSSLLAMFFYNLIKYLYVKKRLGFDPFSWDIAKIILLGLLVCAVNYFLIPTFEPVILDIFLRSALIVLLYGLGIWLMNVAPDSQRMVRERIKMLYSRR
jgi:O-antigen/teichoic acid export membrane protein